jgi:flagellar biosynthesis protein FlhF
LERVPAARPDRRIDELLEEMDELKKSVRMLGKTLPGKSHEMGGSLYGELVSQGIDSDLADKLVTAASRGNPSPTEARERVLRLMADMIIIDPPAELAAKGRVVSAFVGPTGVGKTTTIAKIAGHASARLKKKVALISTDMLRVAGQEQLSRLGALLGVPTYVCSDHSTLKKLIDTLDDRDLILVDTPGASPSDMSRLSKLEAALQENGARVNLVMSATTRSEDVTRIIKRFQPFTPKRVVFTKVDETEFRSAMVGDLLRNELALSYITNGQKVPEDLVIPGAMDLARYVLPTEPGKVQ